MVKPGRPAAIPGSYAPPVPLITLSLAAMLCGGVPSIGALAEGHDPSWLVDDEGKPWVATSSLSRAELMLELEVLHARWRGVGGVDWP